MQAFNQDIECRVEQLNPKNCMKWLKQQIIQNISEEKYLFPSHGSFVCVGQK